MGTIASFSPWTTNTRRSNPADATVRTAIDVVAEKDESRQAPIGMTLAERNQIAQFLQRAVNIPNGVDKRRLAERTVISHAKNLVHPPIKIAWTNRLGRKEKRLRVCIHEEK